MSLYRRDAISPEWEPAPWPMGRKAADEQERGFHERAIKPVAWQPIPWRSFPTEGLFGHDKDWFLSADVAFFASVDGEDLLLIQNLWFGWPDPPEWGLVSRPTSGSDVNWRHWGHFPEPPAAWEVPIATDR
ncbi:MAG: hypothetical protein JWN66_2959 [Sphingomonas bacterium]|uniref:hypothetical protein n=1 Tax=Sphingomonas bacterium TaxID=1895847 RepID=UPI0026273F64|nr:hypothetical protein [Sphingomonas bacterium]MDB5705843.1 hypothetical protein [Sphingomonas bacterium]